MLPFLAQGAAQAIEDAAVLAGAVAAAARTTSPAAFRAYEAARHRRTARVQARLAQAGPRSTTSGPRPPSLRDLVLRLARAATVWRRATTGSMTRPVAGQAVRRALSGTSPCNSSCRDRPGNTGPARARQPTPDPCRPIHRNRTCARAHVIVVANEKGGTGKSTVSIHTTVGLLKAGYRVATIDLDTRQRTLTRFFENRLSWARAGRHRPRNAVPPRARPRRLAIDVGDNETREFADFASAIEQIEHDYEFVVIDTPASRQLPDAARPFAGRHAGVADQRQLHRRRRVLARASRSVAARRRSRITPTSCSKRADAAGRSMPA